MDHTGSGAPVAAARTSSAAISCRLSGPSPRVSETRCRTRSLEDGEVVPRGEQPAHVGAGQQRRHLGGADGGQGCGAGVEHQGVRRGAGHDPAQRDRRQAAGAGPSPCCSASTGFTVTGAAVPALSPVPVAAAAVSRQASWAVMVNRWPSTTTCVRGGARGGGEQELRVPDGGGAAGRRGRIHPDGAGQVQRAGDQAGDLAGQRAGRADRPGERQAGQQVPGARVIGGEAELGAHVGGQRLGVGGVQREHRAGVAQAVAHRSGQHGEAGGQSPAGVAHRDGQPGGQAAVTRQREHARGEGGVPDPQERACRHRASDGDGARAAVRRDLRRSQRQDAVGEPVGQQVGHGPGAELGGGDPQRPLGRGEQRVQLIEGQRQDDHSPGRSAWSISLAPNEGSQHRKFALLGSARAPSCVRGRLRRPCRPDGLQGSVEFAGQGHPAREWPFRSSADGQQTADGLGRRVQLKQDPDPDVVHGGQCWLPGGWHSTRELPGV